MEKVFKVTKINALILTAFTMLLGTDCLAMSSIVSSPRSTPSAAREARTKLQAKVKTILLQQKQTALSNAITSSSSSVSVASTASSLSSTTATVQTQSSEKKADIENLMSWKTFAYKASQLPGNIEKATWYHKAVSWQELLYVCNKFITTLKNDKKITDSSNWVGKKMPDYTYGFSPFAQKRNLPDASKVVLHGDLHGDIHSLLAFIDEQQKKGYLDGFKIIDDTFYMVFLGDYVDRGRFGSEVLYTIMRLKIENPDHVILVRGNHEDTLMNADSDGFTMEIITKFSEDKPDQNGLAAIQAIYEYMPNVLYIGSGKNWAQCNHGGLEMGFDPQALLSGNSSYERINISQLHTNACACLQKYNPKDSELLLYQNTIRCLGLVLCPLCGAILLSTKHGVHYVMNQDEVWNIHAIERMKFLNTTAVNVLKLSLFSGHINTRTGQVSQ